MKNKLLILGATAGETTLVKRAQELGLYVVVTDNHTDYSFSPAKLVADEVWNISWSDIDTLEKLCREHNIKGVTAGYSEFRVDCMIQLCKRLGQPSYCNDEQLEITRDKIKFKKCCIDNGVPVVRDYASEQDVDHFPVIVKPTDRAGSIGISIASNKDELSKACEYALEKSVEKKIIIEDFIENQTKIDLYYAVEKGEVTLITSCDTINAKNNGRDRVVQSAWLYPSRKEDVILERTDSSIRKMIASMGIEFGCIFFSGFINENDDIVFFECGFRLEGGHQYNYVANKGPYNYLDLFIYHAMGWDTANIEHKHIDNTIHCVTLNIYAKQGILSRIDNLDKISEMPTCALAMQIGRIGDECNEEQAILTKIALVQHVSEDAKELQEAVEQSNKLFIASDESDNDIVYDRIDSSIIADWWTEVYNTNNNLCITGGGKIRIIEKDETVSFEDIQALLTLAHQSNEAKGLKYATANQSVETLILKIGNGKCFMAFYETEDNSTLVGTASLEEKTINYWYVNEKPTKVILLKLVGVHPDYRGLHIGSLLLKKRLDYARSKGYDLVVTDSAEDNEVLANLVYKHGFKRVDCCKYDANNFVSAVYAKWLNQECPFTDEECKQRYYSHRNNIEGQEN